MSNQDKSPTQPPAVPEQQDNASASAAAAPKPETPPPAAPEQAQEPQDSSSSAAAPASPTTPPAAPPDLPEQPASASTAAPTNPITRPLPPLPELPEQPASSTAAPTNPVTRPLPPLPELPEQPASASTAAPADPTTPPAAPPDVPEQPESGSTGGTTNLVTRPLHLNHLPEQPASTSAAAPTHPAPPSTPVPSAAASPEKPAGLAPKPSGRTCPKCGHVNRPGVLVCEKCSTLMINEEKSSAPRQPTVELVTAEPARNRAIAETAELPDMPLGLPGGAQFTENMVLRLEIDGAPTPILLHPKFETSIGRRDPASGTLPDVDLSAYAGYRLGVSRKHAVIRFRNERLELSDLGSSNGTSVNGERLTANEPRMLRDGDEVVLGKMVIRILFQIRSRRR